MSRKINLQKEPIKRAGQICKAKRLELGETQWALADAFGFSQSMISQFENGRIDSFVIFYFYCKRYGITDTEMRYILYGN